MTYLYIFLLTIIFSFIGVLNKTAGLMVSPDIIAFVRFFAGSGFLAAYILIKKKPIRLRLLSTLVLIGAAAKALNYITENYGIAKGFSFGNIIVWPVQCVITLLFSIFILKEKMNIRSIVGALFCVIGIGVITWNGTSLDNFIGPNLSLTLIFIVSGIGAAVFLIAIKLLGSKMDAGDSNLSMFIIGAVITFIPVPFTAEFSGEFHMISIIALLLLGLITGAGFMIVAKVLKKIPLFMATLLQSTNVIFTLLWAILFFNEPVTVYIAAGTSVFLAGMVLINIRLPVRKIKE